MQTDKAFYEHFRYLKEERDRRIAALHALKSPVRVRLVRRIPNFMSQEQAYFQVGRSRLRRPTTQQLSAHGIHSTNELRHAIGQVAEVDYLIERMLREASQMAELATRLVQQIGAIASVTAHPPECAELKRFMEFRQQVPPPEPDAGNVPMPFAARAWALTAFNDLFKGLSKLVDDYWGRSVRPTRRYHQRFNLVITLREARNSPVEPRWAAIMRDLKIADPKKRWKVRLRIRGQRGDILCIPTPLRPSVLGCLLLKKHERFYMHVSAFTSRMLKLRRKGQPLWQLPRRAWTPREVGPHRARAITEMKGRHAPKMVGGPL